METFHILHLASCWDIEAQDGSAEAPPIPHAATSPSISPTHAHSTQTQIPDVAASSASHSRLRPPPRIRAAAAQMVFASRTSQDFITPEHVATIEAWTGRAVLDALVGLSIDREVSASRFSLTGCDCGVRRRPKSMTTSSLLMPAPVPAETTRRARQRLGDQGRGRPGGLGGPPVERTACLIGGRTNARQTNRVLRRLYRVQASI